MRVNPLSLKRNFPLLVIKAALVLGLSYAMAASRDLANAQSASGPALYRLNPDSSFQRGCFPPCECPVMITEPVKGTFLLTPTGYDGLFNTYAVTDVNWKFTNYDGTAKLVTGSGTYKVGGEVAAQQELSLYLQTDGGHVEHFDSGLVTESARFPNIQVSISTNGQYCTVFDINASPTPAPQLCIGLSSSNTVVLSWAVSSDHFILQENPYFTMTNWTTVTNTPTVIGQQKQVVLPRSSENRCYRLQPGS
jgi:hypothetical protein